MASAIYPKFKEWLISSALGGGATLPAADVRAILVDAQDYTYATSHEFLSDVPGAARVAASPTLGSKTFAQGVFDAADTSFPTVTGDQSEAIIIYVHTGSDATARLVAYIDSGTGLPVTPSGGNIPVTWNASGIFAL